ASLPLALHRIRDTRLSDERIKPWPSCSLWPARWRRSRAMRNRPSSLGPQGAVARAVIADATRCPPIAVDGGEQAMNVRARPDAAFPVLVCELPLAAGTKSARIAGSENLSLPVLKPTLTSVAAFGDTGCRLKAAKREAKAEADDEERGKFQDCNIPARW